MKKLAKVLALTLILAMLLPLTAGAEFAFVQLGASMYQKPDAKAKATAKYKAGTWLELVQADGTDADAAAAAEAGFVQVIGTNGKAGYVKANDLFILSEHDYAAVAVANNNGAAVNLRDHPGTKNTKILGKVSSGTPMVFGELQDGYYAVTIGGKEGFMSQKLITTGMAPLYLAYAVSANKKPIALRSEPTTNGDILAEMPNASAINVYILGGGWAYVNFNGTMGYMMSKFISGTPEKKEPTPEKGFKDVNITAFVSDGGKSVRYREGPSTDDKVLGKAASGTEVFIYSSNGKWSKISIGFGGKQVYMMAKYLVTIMPIDDDDPMDPYVSYLGNE